MDKVLSARVDEGILDEMDRLTRRLRISKRQFLEEAIRLRAQQVEGPSDVWEETSGAWRRRERPATTVRRAREMMRRSLTRTVRR